MREYMLAIWFVAVLMIGILIGLIITKPHHRKPEALIEQQPQTPRQFTNLGAEYEHKGHSYLAAYNVGIIHSESCTNAAHQPQPWNVLTGSGIPRRVLSVPLQAPITYQPDFIYTNDTWVPNK